MAEALPSRRWSMCLALIALENARLAQAAMVPREAKATPEPLSRGPVSDFGSPPPDPSSPAAIFTHGLAGVNQSANNLFGTVLVVSFMALLAVTLAYQWLNMARSHLRRLFTMGRWEQRYWMHNNTRFWARIKKDLISAPLGRHRHNQEIQLSTALTVGTLPSRFHSLLLSLYLASNIAYCLVLDWSNENSASVLAELRGRTGVLAALNLIPTVLFALRNNPLMPLLGVSYDTFNLLHRWCARIVVVQSIAHTVCWAVNSAQSGGVHQLGETLSTSTSYKWGLIASCTFTFIFLTAGSPIRHAFYETFLNAHRLLVALGLAGVYVHLDTANLPQLPYVQLCLALWIAEWFWRAMRIFRHNVSRPRGLSRVTVEALPADACRVTFDLSREWRWRPGCHVHAYLPAFALWSSHPFSIAWAHNRAVGEPLEIELEKLPMQEGIRPSGMVGSRVPSGEGKHTDGANVSLKRTDVVTSISLIIRARTGMTRALYDRAVSAPKATISTWGAIEGPYGGHESFASYGTVLLFAGGVGITHCIGYVHHLILQYEAGTSSVQKILLIWSVPNTEALEWVRMWMDKILKMEGRRDILRIQLFVTKPRNRAEVVSNTGSVQMFPGRCNPQTIVEKTMEERIGAVGVTCCGPGVFSDSVRSAVRSVMTLGAIDYIEESFTY